MKIHRSPVAPSRTLKTCIHLIQAIYDVYGNAVVNKEDIGQALNVASTGGYFSSLMASFNQFGLLQKEGTGLYSVSQTAKDYFSIPSNETATKIQARQSFIKHVEVYYSLIKDLQGRVPTPTNLESLLMTQYGFKRPRAARAAKVFYDSLSWAGILDQKGNVVPEKLNPDHNITINHGMRFDTAVTNEAHSSLEETTVDNTNLNALIRLSEGRVLEISYPQDLTTREAARVFALLKPICIDWEPDSD